MIALLRARHERGSNSNRSNAALTPHHPAPTIVEPPSLPSPQSRRDKERAWFSSIRGRSKDARSHSHSHSEPSAHGTSVAGAPGPAPASEAANPSSEFNQSTASKPLKSSASIRSLTSKSSFLGLKRRKSNASLRKAASEETLDASFTFVPGTHEVPPMPASAQPSGTNTTTTTSTFSPLSSSATAATTTASGLSKPLPARLQELSVAHSDGLLDEDEYRMLRAALLEKHAAQGQDTIDQDSLQLGSLGLRAADEPVQSYSATTKELPSLPRGSQDRPASLRPAALTADSASSIRSGRSSKSTRSRSSRLFNSFTPRKATSLRDDWDSLHQAHRNSLALDSDMQETLSINMTSSRGSEQQEHHNHTQHGTTGTGGDLPVRDTRKTRLPPLTLSNASASQYTTPAQSPSGSLRSSAASMTRGVSSAASIMSGSSAGHRSIKGKALSSVGSINSHGFETDDDPYAEASPTQLRREISQLQAERARVTEQFDQLIGQARSRVASSSSTKTATPSSSSSHAPAAPLGKSQKRLSAISTSGRFHPKANSSNTLAPPPSHIPTLSHSSGAASSSSTTPRSADEGQKPHIKEALHLSKKRDKVQQRYDTQLEFLKVKLQGAELRQSLQQ